jgi:dephospho-CoA kinase
MKKLTQNLFITGPAGSGKIFFTKYLQKLGINAHDTDEIRGLAKWIDKKGNKVPFPKDPAKADKAWFKQHKFVWDRKRLKDFITKNQPVIILGVSDIDIMKFKNLFDKSFYLQVSPKVASERLAHRWNLMGATAQHRERVMKEIKSFDTKAKKHGFIMLDANKKPERIWKQLQKHL